MEVARARRSGAHCTTRCREASSRSHSRVRLHAWSLAASPPQAVTGIRRASAAKTKAPLRSRKRGCALVHDGCPRRHQQRVSRIETSASVQPRFPIAALGVRGRRRRRREQRALRDDVCRRHAPVARHVAALAGVADPVGRRAASDAAPIELIADPGQPGLRRPVRFVPTVVDVTAYAVRVRIVLEVTRANVDVAALPVAILVVERVEWARSTSAHAPSHVDVVLRIVHARVAEVPAPSASLSDWSGL